MQGLPKRIVLLSTVYCLLSTLLSGCASFGKKKDLEIQGLRNQISALETQIQSKDEEINTLKDDLNRARQERIIVEEPRLEKKVAGEVKSRPNIRQIQTALKNAGFDPGRIDGKMGKQTRNAIRAFQKANKLSVDGKAGKETWNLLKEYLYKKVK